MLNYVSHKKSNFDDIYWIANFEKKRGGGIPGINMKWGFNWYKNKNFKFKCISFTDI